MKRISSESNVNNSNNTNDVVNAIKSGSRLLGDVEDLANRQLLIVFIG